MVQRELYLEKLRQLKDKDIIKVITGVRRCGKSYLLELFIKELINNGIKQENIILINFDSGKYNNINEYSSLDELVLKLTEKIEGKVYLFFDEIQNVKFWEKSIVSYYVDLDCDIYITGSNSNLLSGELSTHLTGRYIEIKIYPFSFNEFCEYKLENMEIDKTNEDLIKFYKQQWLDEFIRYGSFPFSLSINKEYKLNYMQDIFNSILYKDLIERYSVRDVAILNKLIIFLLDNVGNIFSANSISNFLKKENISISSLTIQNYLKYFENACIFNKVLREDIKGKKILSTNEKYYVVDIGFIHAIRGINQVQKNRGHIIENIVYLELVKRGYSVRIGKLNGSEIDFLCKKSDEVFYIQVTERIHEANRNREFDPLLKVKDVYPKYIISEDVEDKSNNGIKHINLLDFLINFLD
ncbi:ATP-binding protein [uncultured Methanobrevibacter sp.]|uniref:ATP-binding protein n=1 Tax=uncultured Methanobrevibacter sp. TaxID=253161 RepID=UPI0025DB2CF2|nr:ATP-binding protein [uncultured Methanobrevibacter sp.]